MSILDTILSRAAGREQKAAIASAPGWAIAGAADEKARLPEYATVEKQVDLYQRLSWVQTAIGVRARIAAATPFEVRTMSGEGSTAIENHPFELRLRNPNPLQSRFEFLEATFAWRAATGNAYWWLNRSDEGAEPSELWIVPSYQIRPIPDGKSYIAGYAYDAGDGKAMLLQNWEICHFKTWNPLSKYVGLSPLTALRFATFGDLAAQEYNARFYAEDNAKSAGILAFAEMVEEGKWQRLMAQLKEEYGGRKRRQMMPLRGVGAGGLQWIPTQMSRQDMEYLSQRQFTKEEIFAIFAPGLASTLAINANEANARVGNSNLRELAVYPDHVAVSEKITNDLLPTYGDNLIGEFEDVRQRDQVLELQQIQEAARYHTIDEIRQEFYNHDPLGDDRGGLLAAEVGKGMTDARDPADKPPPPPPAAFGQQQAQQPQPPAVESVEEAGKQLDRQRWQKKAIKALASGRSPDVPFTPDYLHEDEAMPIRAALKRAQSAQDIAQVFAKKRDAVDELIDDVIDEAFTMAQEIK